MIKATQSFADIALTACVWWYRVYLIILLIIGIIVFIASFFARGATYTKTDAVVLSDSIMRNQNDYETRIAYVIVSTPDSGITPPPSRETTLSLTTKRYKDEVIPVWYNNTADDQVSTSNPSNASVILLVISLVMITGSSVALWFSYRFPQLFCAAGVINDVSGLITNRLN